MTGGCGLDEDLPRQTRRWAGKRPSGRRAADVDTGFKEKWGLDHADTDRGG